MQFDVSMELVKGFKLASIIRMHSTINQIKPFSLLVAILSLIDLPILCSCIWIIIIEHGKTFESISFEACNSIFGPNPLDTWPIRTHYCNKCIQVAKCFPKTKNYWNFKHTAFSVNRTHLPIQPLISTKVWLFQGFSWTNVRTRNKPTNAAIFIWK